jgi:hypothetical protein
MDVQSDSVLRAYQLAYVNPESWLHTTGRELDGVSSALLLLLLPSVVQAARGPHLIIYAVLSRCICGTVGVHVELLCAGKPGRRQPRSSEPVLHGSTPPPNPAPTSCPLLLSMESTCSWLEAVASQQPEISRASCGRPLLLARFGMLQAHHLSLLQNTQRRSSLMVRVVAASSIELKCDLVS